jgi:hypothetical protein
MKYERDLTGRGLGLIDLSTWPWSMAIYMWVVVEKWY